MAVFPFPTFPEVGIYYPTAVAVIKLGNECITSTRGRAPAESLTT